MRIMPIIYVTHTLDEVDLADHIILLESGRVKASEIISQLGLPFSVFREDPSVIFWEKTA